MEHSRPVNGSVTAPHANMYSSIDSSAIRSNYQSMSAATVGQANATPGYYPSTIGFQQPNPSVWTANQAPMPSSNDQYQMPVPQLSNAANWFFQSTAQASSSQDFTEQGHATEDMPWPPAVGVVGGETNAASTATNVSFQRGTTNATPVAASEYSHAHTNSVHDLQYQ